jgi:hypothetical protein
MVLTECIVDLHTMVLEPYETDSFIRDLRERNIDNASCEPVTMGFPVSRSMLYHFAPANDIETSSGFV